jgi:hypothetical protein
MHRAHRRGPCCHLTAEMIQSLALYGDWREMERRVTKQRLILRIRPWARFCGRTAQGRSTVGDIFRSARPTAKRPDRPSPAGVSLGERREHFTATLPGFP